MRSGSRSLSIPLLTLVVSGALALSACETAGRPTNGGGAEPLQSAGPNDSLIDLSGTWVAVDVPKGAPNGLADTKITLSGDVGGVFVGCNHIGFALRATESRVEISDMSMTQMLCEEVMEAEGLVTEGLMTPDAVSIVESDRMALELPNGTVLNLERVGAVPDKLSKIAGTWRTTTVGGSYEVLSWTPDDGHDTGLEEAALTVTGRDFDLTVGCNHFSGIAEDSGPNVILGGDFMVTEMSCQDLKDAEDLLARSLRSGITVRIMGDDIHLELADKIMLGMSRVETNGTTQSDG